MTKKVSKVETPEVSVKTLEKEIVPFVEKAEKVTIKNAQDMEQAAEILSNVNRYADNVKKSKESITKPISESLKNIRALFSPLEDRLGSVIEGIRTAMSVYQTEQKRIADEEAAKIAARVGDGKGKIKIETAISKIDAIEKPEKRVVTETGSVRFTTVPCFEVMDVTLLPADYILANEVKIRTAMKAGIQIPGVRYYTEERPVNNR